MDKPKKCDIESAFRTIRRAIIHSFIADIQSFDSYANDDDVRRFATIEAAAEAMDDKVKKLESLASYVKE